MELLHESLKLSRDESLKEQILEGIKLIPDGIVEAGISNGIQIGSSRETPKNDKFSG